MRKLFSFLLVAVLLFACADKSPKKSGKVDLGSSRPSTQVNKDPYAEQIKANPDDASLYLARAKWNMEQGKFAHAVGDLDYAEKLDSTIAELFLLRGESHFFINKSREARNDYEKCVKLDPENLNCRLKLAQLYMYVEMTEASFKHLEKALELDPNNAEAYFIAGMNYKTLKDTAKAIKQFQASADIEPTVQAFENIGVMYAAQGNEVALDYYENALNVNPSSVSVHYNLGNFYQEKQDWNKALEYYTRALQLNADHLPSLFAVGYVHVELKMWDEAMANFSRAVKVKPDYIQAWYARGYVFEMKGDVENAKRCYQRSLDILETYQPAIIGLQRLERGEQLTTE